MRRGIRRLAALRIIQQRRQRWRRQAWKTWAAWIEASESAVDDFDEAVLDSDLVEVSDGFVDSDFTEVDFAVLEDIDLAALYTIFSDMDEFEGEFLPDGRPRVDAVVGRLRDMGLPGKVNRQDIDEAFEQWQKRKSSG